MRTSTFPLLSQSRLCLRVDAGTCRHRRASTRLCCSQRTPHALSATYFVCGPRLEVSLPQAWPLPEYRVRMCVNDFVGEFRDTNLIVALCMVWALHRNTSTGNKRTCLIITDSLLNEPFHSLACNKGALFLRPAYLATAFFERILYGGNTH